MRREGAQPELRWTLAVSVLLVGADFATSDADAQELEPRAYANLPVGLNFLVGGYLYSQGGLATDPAVPIEDAELRLHTAVAAYARSLDVFGMSAKFDAVVPYGWLSGSADVAGERREREVAGFYDPKVRFTLNFFGAPALSMDDFASYQQDIIVGASIQVSAPLGQYDPQRLVNLGTNRWSVKTELGISKAWGRLTAEIAPSVTLYTDNNDFFGDARREQAPLYAAQGHLIYSADYGIWISLDATYYIGGRTTVDGVENDDRLSNSRIGVTLAIPVDRRHSVKLYGSSGISTRTGEDFDRIGVAWQYRWGDEL
jgi:hypothetical protein